MHPDPRNEELESDYRLPPLKCRRPVTPGAKLFDPVEFLEWAAKRQGISNDERATARRLDER